MNKVKAGDFTGLAKDYSLHRPGYCHSVLKGLLGLLKLPVSQIDFADVGAGTGIWTRRVSSSRGTFRYTSKYPGRFWRFQSCTSRNREIVAITTVNPCEASTPQRREYCSAKLILPSRPWFFSLWLLAPKTFRSSSPSKKITGTPSDRSRLTSSSAKVVFPAPDRPVIQMTLDNCFIK